MLPFRDILEKVNSQNSLPFPFVRYQFKFLHPIFSKHFHNDFVVYFSNDFFFDFIQKIRSWMNDISKWDYGISKKETSFWSWTSIFDFSNPKKWNISYYLEFLWFICGFCVQNSYFRLRFLFRTFQIAYLLPNKVNLFHLRLNFLHQLHMISLKNCKPVSFSSNVIVVKPFNWKSLVIYQALK